MGASLACQARQVFVVQPCQNFASDHAFIRIVSSAFCSQPHVPSIAVVGRFMVIYSMLAPKTADVEDVPNHSVYESTQVQRCSANIARPHSEGGARAAPLPIKRCCRDREPSCKPGPNPSPGPDSHISQPRPKIDPEASADTPVHRRQAGRYRLAPRPHQLRWPVPSPAPRS